MALYGLYAADPKTGAADARARRARNAAAARCSSITGCATDLREPLRIGIGIHYSEAIVGAMGPPRSQIITAIGDTVNTCARLESLTKDYDCAVVISRQAAEAAGLRLDGHELHQAPVKGRNEPVQFYALQTLAEFRQIYCLSMLPKTGFHFGIMLASASEIYGAAMCQTLLTPSPVTSPGLVSLVQL